MTQAKLWGTWKLELGLPRRGKKALEPKMWPFAHRQHMTISTIGAVTNLLEQHSFAFRAVSCVETTNPHLRAPKPINT